MAIHTHIDVATATPVSCPFCGVEAPEQPCFNDDCPSHWEERGVPHPEHPGIPLKGVPWHDQPEARAAIARVILTDELATRHFKHYPLTRDEWRSYDGPAGRAVDAIRSAEGTRLLDEAHQSDDYAAFAAHCDQPSAVEAIDAVYDRMMAHIAAETRVLS